MSSEQNPPPGSRRRVRRRPQMVPFLLTGAFVGFVAGGVISFVGPNSERASAAQEMIALAVPGLLLGGLLGAILFLVVERLSGRS